MHIQGVCSRKSLSTAEGMFGQLNYEEMLRIKRQHNKKKLGHCTGLLI